jgi:magnesium-transporting ATPase (P-type)
MVTGDHVGTATAIARQVEILPAATTARAEAGDARGADATAAAVTIAPVFDALSKKLLDALPALPRVVARCAPATKVSECGCLGCRCRSIGGVLTDTNINTPPRR